MRGTEFPVGTSWISQEEKAGFPVVGIQGYCDDEAGKTLIRMVEGLHLKGKSSLILDFSACKVINSQGISSLLDLAYLITEDYGGILVLTGIRPLYLKALKMAFIVPPAIFVPSVRKGLSLLASCSKKPQPEQS